MTSLTRVNYMTGVRSNGPELAVMPGAEDQVNGANQAPNNEREDNIFSGMSYVIFCVGAMLLTVNPFVGFGIMVTSIPLTCALFWAGKKVVQLASYLFPNLFAKTHPDTKIAEDNAIYSDTLERFRNLFKQSSNNEAEKFGTAFATLKFCYKQATNRGLSDELRRNYVQLGFEACQQAEALKTTFDDNELHELYDEMQAQLTQFEQCEDEIATLKVMAMQITLDGRVVNHRQ